MNKKLLSFLLVLAMLFTCISAFADGELPTEGTVNETVEENASEEASEAAPEADPETSPEVAPEEVPEATPESVPEAAPEAAPEADPETSPEVAPEEVPEATPESVPEAESEAVPEVATDATTESAPEAAPEVAPIVFSEGYVRLTEDNVAYSEMNDQAEAASFAAGSVVYAEMAQEGVDFASSWLKITFDTEEAKEAEAEFAVAYVLGGDVEILEQAAVEELTAQWALDETIREYEGKKLPAVTFQVKAVDEEVTEEPAPETPTNDDDLFDFGTVDNDLFSRDGANQETSNDELNFGSENTNQESSGDELDFGSENTDQEASDDELAFGSEDTDQEVSDDELAFGSEDTEQKASDGELAFGSEQKNQEASDDELGFGSEQKTEEVDDSEGTASVTEKEATLDQNNVTEEDIESGEEKEPDEVDGETAEEALSLITVQPKNTVADENGNVSFTVEAEGDVTYQWQMSDDGEDWKDIPGDSKRIEGATTATLSFKVSSGTENKLFRCIVSDSVITTTSKVVLIGEELEADFIYSDTMGEGGPEFSNNENEDDLLQENDTLELISRSTPVITVTPSKQYVGNGETVKFTATESNVTGQVTRQWEISNDGTNWSRTTLSGYNTKELTVTANKTRIDGRYYHLKVTDANGTSWYSNAVKVNFVEITAAADKQSVSVGEVVKFTATESNVPDQVTRQWEISDDGKKWSRTTLSGYNTKELTVTATKARIDGRYYRLKVTNPNGTAWYSNSVKVNYVSNPVITVTPSKQDVSNGETVKFTATESNVTGQVTRQWEISNDGTNWTKTTLSGYNTKELTVIATKTRIDGRYYHLKVTDANGTAWYSNAVKVNYVPNPVITVTPSKQYVGNGETVKFTATESNVTGQVTRQWEISNDGTNWTKTTLSGYNTKELTVTANKTRIDGRYYHLKVTDANGTAWYSNAVKVDFVEITAAADKQSASDGEIVKFTATESNVTGQVTRQWEISNDGTNWSKTTLSGYNTNELTVTANKTRIDGRYYRLKVTNANGTAWYSNAVKVEYKGITTYTENSVTYEIIEGTQNARVKSYTGSASSVNVLATVTIGGANYNVTEIGEEAFMGNTSVTSVSLPNGITAIRARAFKNCSNLATMTSY